MEHAQRVSIFRGLAEQILLSHRKMRAQSEILRAKLRRLAKCVREPMIAQLERILDGIGPETFHLELIRARFDAYGFIHDRNESLAETCARALQISMSELRDRLERGS